jgi:pimeloyl-ACP methyl ester carboxylesterase
MAALSGILLSALLATVVYVLVALWSARWFALTDHAHAELMEIELPTPGHHIALYHHTPAERRFAEPVIVCHGLGANRFNMDFSDDGSGSDRISIARAILRAGFDVWVLELRGRGRATVPRGADWTIDDEVREDLQVAIDTVLDLSGQDRVLWVGHSKGSILQYLLQADQLPAAAKVKAMVAIGSPGHLSMLDKDMARLIGLGRLFAARGRPVPLATLAKLGIPIAGIIHLLGRRMLPVVAAIDAPILRRIMASLATDIAPGVMKQLARWFESGGAMTRSDGTKYEDAFPKITLPMLLIAGSKDLLAPPESMRFVFDRVSSTDKTLVVMGKKDGASSDYGHGDLVIAKRAPDEVFPKVIEWLGTHATSFDHPGLEREAPRSANAIS